MKGIRATSEERKRLLAFIRLQTAKTVQEGKQGRKATGYPLGWPDLGRRLSQPWHVLAVRFK